MAMLARGDIRPSALAGRWYPGTARALEDAVHGYLGRATPSDLGRVHAIITPHAGYAYSGATAGWAFAAARHQRFSRAVVVGPAHRVAFHGISAGDFAAYETPLGRTEVDRSAIADLERAGLVACHPRAHVHEHSLEILLPFVREALGDVPIIPLLVGRAEAAQVARALSAALRDDDLLVVSSDLSHFMPYDAAVPRDGATLETIARGEVDDLDGYDACGYLGVRGASAVADARGWRRTVLDYRNSAHATGDRTSVVGYGAVAMSS